MPCFFEKEWNASIVIAQSLLSLSFIVRAKGKGRWLIRQLHIYGNCFSNLLHYFRDNEYIISTSECPFLDKEVPLTIWHTCVCAVCVCVCLAFPKGLYQDIYDMFTVHGERERSIDRLSLSKNPTHANVPVTKTSNCRLMVNLEVA